jgi:hypothetical protein
VNLEDPFDRSIIIIREVGFLKERVKGDKSGH